MPMYFLIVANPVSGTGKGKSIAETLKKHLVEKGHRVRLRTTKSSGDATRFANEINPDERLIVVGGDGTVHEVINGIRLSKPPEILVVPTGTGNVLAAELQLPESISGFVRLAQSNRCRWLDVVRTDRLRYVLMAGLGFDGDVVHTFHSERSGTTHMSRYVSAGIRAFLQNELPTFTLVLDGTMTVKDVSFAQVANVRNYGGPLLFSPGARPDNGYLEVSWLRDRHKAGLFQLCLGAALGIPKHLSSFRSHRCRHVEVQTVNPPRVQIDGDPVEGVPEEMSIVPRSVPFLTPLSSRNYVC